MRHQSYYIGCVPLPEICRSLPVRAARPGLAIAQALPGDPPGLAAFRWRRANP